MASITQTKSIKVTRSSIFSLRVTLSRPARVPIAEGAASTGEEGM